MRAHRIQTAVTTAAIIGFGTALLWRPQAVAGGVSRGLAICGSVLIPSVFPFLILGGFLIRSGVAAAIGRRLETVTRFVFGLPGCCAAGILLGAIGGYPAGGVAVGELMRSGQIDRAQGKRMLWFCVNGGPGFVISAVGAGLMGNVQFGALLFLAHLTASLLLGILSVPHGARHAVNETARSRGRAASPITAFVESVTNACESMVYMCGFVLLFGAVLALVDAGFMVNNRTLSAFLACILEVSCGCTAASSLGPAAVPLLGFAVGFGGVSVHCQLASSLRGLGVIDRNFFLARVIHGSLTALLTVLLLRWIPLSRPVWGPMQQPVVQSSYGSMVLSVALLVFAGVWVLCMGQHLDKGRRDTV